MGVTRNIDLTQVFSPHFALIGYIAWNKNHSRRQPGELVATGVTLKKRFLTDGEEAEGEITQNFYLRLNHVTSELLFAFSCRYKLGCRGTKFAVIQPKLFTVL